MKFRYSGYDRAAQKVSGELDATSEVDARMRLRNQNIRPLRLMAEGEKSIANFSFGALLSFGNSGKPDLFEFTAFIRQFATMQSAGIPIVQTIGVLADQVENRQFGKVLLQVKQHIEEGHNFADALKRHPKVFDRIFINLVAAGELSGSLEQILGRLAQYYEKSAALRRKVKSAMTYPAVIISLVVVVIAILMIFVVPIFSQMFASNGKELPVPTQIVVNISNFLRSHIILLLLGVGGAVGGIIFFFQDEKSRRQIDPWLMQLPIFGDLFKKIGIARFARTLGTMIQSGVPILEALDITARVAGNYAIEAAITSTRNSISSGNSIAAPLEAARVFPKMAISMIAIGEQTGALDQMLTKIAEFYEDEVDNKVGSLTSLLEPLMIVIVGLVVAGVLIPMYLPIFKLGDTLSGGS